MRVSEKEIESVTKLSATERYKYFIKRIADWESMYSLKKGEQWAISEVDETKVVSFWSAPAFAAVHIDGPWSTYKIFEIDLDMFENEITSMIEDEGYLLNIFPVKNNPGLIVDLEKLIRDLNTELENY